MMTAYSSPQKTSSCSDLFARLSRPWSGRGQLVLLALVWERRAQGASGGRHRGFVVCMQHPCPPAQTCIVQAADRARAPGERRGK